MSGSQDTVDADGFREAHDQLDYELVEVHENLTVPSSTPARFEYQDPPAFVDAGEIERRLRDSQYAFIDVGGHNGEEWYEFSVDATVFGEEAERAKLSLSTAGVTIVQDREEPLTWNFFRSLVSIAEETLDASLEYRGETDV